jgi:hypothetical protein
MFNQSLWMISPREGGAAIVALAPRLPLRFTAGRAITAAMKTTFAICGICIIG